MFGVCGYGSEYMKPFDRPLASAQTTDPNAVSSAIPIAPTHISTNANDCRRIVERQALDKKHPGPLPLTAK
jgi:hypothetical protein